MSKPYAIDNLYKFRSDFSNHTFDGEVIIIDDFFENAEDIYNHITNRDYPLWKYNPESRTRNHIDYNDCRITDTIGHPTRINEIENQRLLDLCRQYFWKGHYDFKHIIEFNCFQTITQFDNKYQHYPHIDSRLDASDEDSTLNMLVYMDKEDDGGTAIYGGEWITNDENIDLLYPVEDIFTLQRVIPAKFNRCAIFAGNRMHGAYINDYNKFKDDKWRYTFVRFYHPR